ncbi:MAG TPA: hypothetical protein VHL11_20605, partial [Phototrophicaceae bacterium]|nr:hypothetical protein [Phototrophicaceae bacterium]
DAENNVYVADFNNIRIQKFDSDGNFLLQWATEAPRGPASLGIDADGYIYVDNFFPHKHHLQKFDAAGTLVSEWGATGGEPGQFGAKGASGPEDVAIDQAGNIYVSDRVNHRVQKFDPDGNLLTIFGGEASKDGQGLFDQPLGLAVASSGNLYVLDVGSKLLQLLDADGKFIAQWSTKGGDLDQAIGIVALDSNDDLYIMARGEVMGANGKATKAIVLKKFQHP